MDTPTYTIELYDINGNYVLDISRFIQLDYTLTLNEAETAKFELDLDAFEQLCHSVGLVPRNVLYPARTEVRVRRDDHTLMGLRVIDAKTTIGDDGKKLAVTCDGYLNYFARRLVRPRHWINTDRSLIAWQAIDEVQARQYGDLGVRQGALANVYSSDFKADFTSVKQIIQTFTTAEPVTYDFEITADKIFNTYLRKGSDKPNIELVYSGQPNNPADTIQSFNAPRESDTLANEIIGLGSGIGSERRETIQGHLASQIEYLILEQKETFNAIEDTAMLENATKGVLQESYGVLVVPEVTLYPNAVNLTTLQTGDSVRVRIEQDSSIATYNDDINGLYRISKINVAVDQNGAESIKLQFFNPSAGGEIAEY